MRGDEDPPWGANRIIEAAEEEREWERRRKTSPDAFRGFPRGRCVWGFGLLVGAVVFLSKPY